MNPRGKAQCIEWYVETKSPLLLFGAELEEDSTGLMSGYRNPKIPVFTRNNRT